MDWTRFKQFGRQRIFRLLALILIPIIAIAIIPMGLRVNAQGSGQKPNILVIWGDDIGQSNISAYTNGLVGYRTPNIDRIAKEGVIFTDYYGEQSCTAAAIPNSECSPRHKNLKVPTGKGFAMKIPNEETRKNSGQREKRGHQA